MLSYRLLGSEASYYTGKVRAYLRYKGIAFEEIVASSRVYKEIIIPRTGVRYIPVLISPNDNAIQDTTDIIDFIESRFPDVSVYPETPRQKLTALLFELYADEWLKLPAMYYRWWFKKENYDFIVREFGKTAAPDASLEEQRLAGEKVAEFFGGSLPILGITQKNHQQIEFWYEAFLGYFNTHLKHHNFLLGSRPSIGDFGLIGPLYAHLYRDPYPGKLMREKAPLVAQWVERMNNPEPLSGNFLSDDQVPDTLAPILKMVFKEHFPVLQDTVKKVEQWVKDNAEQNLPRIIGQHQFSIGGVTETRYIFPYDQWMFQRPLDFYQSLIETEKKKTDLWLENLDGFMGMQTKIRLYLQRVNNQLMVKI